MSALAAAKETGRGAPSVIAAACLAQVSASLHCSALLLREEVRGVGWVSFCYHRFRATTKCLRCSRAIGVDDKSGIQVSTE